MKLPKKVLAIALATAMLLTCTFTGYAFPEFDDTVTYYLKSQSYLMEEAEILGVAKENRTGNTEDVWGFPQSFDPETVIRTTFELEYQGSAFDGYIQSGTKGSGAVTYSVPFDVFEEKANTYFECDYDPEFFETMRATAFYLSKSTTYTYTVDPSVTYPTGFVAAGIENSREGMGATVYLYQVQLGGDILPGDQKVTVNETDYKVLGYRACSFDNWDRFTSWKVVYEIPGKFMALDDRGANLPELENVSGISAAMNRPLYMDVDQIEVWSSEDPDHPWTEFEFFSLIDLTVNYKDGTSETQSVNEWDMALWRYSEELRGCMVSPLAYSCDQSPEKPWGIGSHEATVHFFGFSTTVSLEVRENPFDSVKLTFGSELISGAFEELRDAEPTLIFHAKDGDTVDVPLRFFGMDTDNAAFRMDGYSNNYYSCKLLADTLAIGDNTVTGEVFGLPFSGTVKMIENPVQSISVNTIGLIQGIDGYPEIVWDDQKGDFIESGNFIYEFNKTYSMLELTVNYKDGTSEVRRGWDGLYDAAGHNYLMVNMNETYESQSEDPFTLGNTYTIGTCEWWGCTCDLKIRIIENPVESFSLKATLPLIQNWLGYEFSISDDEFGYHYELNYTLPTLTVNYKDGTSATYESVSIYNVYDITGYSLGIVDMYDYDESGLSIGKHTFTAEYLGCTAPFEVEIIETPVQSIEVIPTKKLQELPQYPDEDPYYYVEDTNPMIVIHYQDGTTLTCPCSKIYAIFGYGDVEMPFGGDSDFKTDQWETPWGIGKHTVTYSAAGVTTTFEVEVVSDGSELDIPFTEPVTFSNDRDIIISGDCNAFDPYVEMRVDPVASAEALQKATVALADISGQFVAYDISAYNYLLEEPAQPNSPVKVTFPLPEDFQNADVYYISADGEAEKLPSTVDPIAKTVTVTLEHFSTYAIVKSDAPLSVLGDVDGDGSINSTDARLILQYYAKKINESQLNIAVADVDGDGSINSTDARLILQLYAKKISKFPKA